MSRVAIWTYGCLALAGVGLGLMLLSFDGSPRRFIWLFVFTCFASFGGIAGGLLMIVARARRLADRLDRATRGEPDTIDAVDRLPGQGPTF